MKSTGICRWLFLLISLTTWTTTTSSKEMRVVCYYTNWSVYRPGAAKFSPQNINPYLCTHLVYAFGGFTKENRLKPFDKYQDIEKGGYAKFTGLKTYNKNLKTLLAIGGWNEGSSRFSPMVANPERRKELVKNAIKFLRQNHFDGLDLDWEYPSFRDGGKPRDRDNYAQLVQELREEFDRESEKTGRPRLLLTMAVPAGIEYINKGYDIPKLTKYLDWMNILSYDYHSAFEPAVNHHAPLYSLEEDNEYNYDAELNIDYTIKHYLKLGADPDKLVLGIPTYGRSYTLFNPDANAIGAPADGPGEMGEATRENGYMAYYEICDYVKNQGWQEEQPNPDAMGPYAYKDNQWVGYDDEAIARKKSEYVAENGLGGIMFWAIDNDDFRGTCHGRPYPLIEAAKEALMEAYGLTDANLISPPSKPIKSKPRPRPKPTSKPKPVEEEAKPLKIHNRRRNRNKSKAKEEDRPSAVSRLKPRRKESRTTPTASTQASTYSSLKVTTPSYTTPAPPSTPDLDGAFKCEEDGFFQHPKDCKKYFWCLSGAGDTGITAHAFTCPAGLYFNKAADSCDYAQNVLCNKKLQKPVTAAPEKTSSSTTTTTTAAASPSTSRAPPKITAATSRTTFRQSTTTEAYEDDDYEYEDEEEEKSKEDEDSKTASEEDPKVIKELIDLIKKAGGIEELEKQLSKGGPSGKPGLDTTTQTAISKSLYERVLSKAKNSLSARKPTPTGIRNSRGPQNDGLSKAEEKPSRGKTERGKLQYTSISRNRPSTEKSVEDETDEEEEGEEVKDETAQPRRLFNKKSQPEYVTIRRPRVSSTTEASNTSGVNRNKILGEVLDDDDDEEYDDEEEEDDDDVAEDEAPKKTFSPQYVNIRRQRPSTTEASSTSKYKEIRRGTTTEATTEANDDTDGSKYKILRRGSTTSSPTTVSTEESNSSKYQLLRRGMTPTTATTPTDDSTSKYKNFRRGGTTEKPSSEPEEATSKYKQLRRGTAASTTASSSTTEGAVDTGNVVRNLTTPTDEENYVTPSLEVISGSTTATATASEPTLTTVSNSPVESSIGSSTTSTSSTTPSSTSQDPTTNSVINLVDEAATTQKESPVPATEKYPETTKSDAADATTAEARSPSISTTEPTGIDPTTIKQRPRPFSSIGRSTARPATAEPSSTTQAAKVSQSKFKLRSRPKPLHKDVVSKKAVPTTDAPNTTIKPRGRGLPRTTTERPAEERTYRPTELADFSSLTAVDFAQIKELDAAQTTHRRRRPTTTPPTTTISSNVEDEKDADKTPPPETKPGRGRRITSKKLDSIELDASATTRSGRGFGLRSTRTPTTTTESAENAIKEGSETVNVTPRGRRVVRRFRTTTKSANGIGETLNKTSTEAPAIKRGKFFTAQNRNQSSLLKTPRGSKNPLQRLFNKKPTRLPYGLQRNNVEEESDDSLEDTSTEEGENIKLSESNIRENSDVNSFDTSGKQRRKLVKLVRQKSDNLHAKNTQLPGKTTTESSKTTTTKNSEVITTTTQEAATTDAVTEQGTTTVRRGKDTESFTTIHPESTSATKTTEITEDKTKSKSSLFRTRKVIRKLKPKAITTATSVENNSNRRRKLIRRRPVTATTEDKKDEESVIATTTTTAATTTSDNATNDNATNDADNTTTTANPDADDAAAATTTTPATTLRSRGINRLTTVPIESTTSAVKEETPKRLIRPFNRPKIRPYGRAPTSSTSRSTTVSGSTSEPSKESGRRVFRPRLGAIPRRTVPNRVRPPPRTTTRQPVDATEHTTVGREITTTLNYPSRRRLPKRPGFGTTTTDVFTTEPVTELTAETMPATVKNYEEPATTESGMETSTMFSETMESKDEDGNVKVVKSSTSIYNLYKPLNGEKDFDSEEDTKKNDTVDPMDKRNYVSVFRSSTTSNSFDNFDSEFDETHPHLRDDSDESYLDSAYGDDGYDTELEGGHGDGDGDDEDEDQTDEADTVDTSTEYRPARRGSSYLPIDDFAQYESMAESSSVRNRFTKPDKLPADRVTPSPKKGPKPRQKFKSITKSSNKSILKETIQIHSFNDSDPHGKMAEVVVNRFKYRTLERTTVLPDLENSSEDSSESSDEATIPIDLTTLLNLDESNESTESGEEQDDRYDSRETTEDSNEKTENYKSAETTEKYSEEVTLPNPEVSTNLNAEYRENEIIEYSTATNEISTQRQFTTTEDAPQTESNQITSTTSATVVELNDIDSTTTGSVEEVTSTAGTTIEGTTVEGSTETEVTETPTTTTPKVTTPYQRRSTLRPIESRPKFTPIRRKSSYLGTSTTEASNRSLNRFNRNRFKSTTEGADKPVKSTRNRFSYRQSSTTEKPNAIEDDDNKDEEKGDSVTENVIEDDSSVTKPLPTTTAVPLSDFIYSYTTTEAAQVKEESGKLEEQEEEKVDDKNERESSEEKGEEEKGEEETEIEKEEKEEEQEEKGEEETKVEKEEKEERQGENEEREQEKEEKQEEQKETKEEKVEEKVVKKPVRPSVNFRPRLPGSKPKVANRPPSGRRPSNSPIRSSGPYFGRSTTPRVINKPKFAKTTETPKVEEDMSGIDTEALKNRNKNLYSKKRVPNRPVTPSTTTAAAETAEPLTEIPEEITTEPGVTQDRITTATPITEAVTKPSSVETTESLTTLHHIFSAVDDDTTKNRTETTTEALSPAVTATTGKVEKLIEVSRIVKVKTKGAKSKNHNVVEEQSTSEVAPVKIGLVNRVTSIKVVGGNDTDSSLSEAAATTENAHTSIGIPAKVEEIPASEVQAKVNLTDIRVTINNIADLLHTHREDRKIDGVGDNDNRLTSGEKAQVIDGKSHINVFTPRPLFATEASTIALEGLFQTESPEQSAATPKPLNSVANDEILETENSRFVNVRVLHQDDKPTKGINDNSKFFPVKILPQDDEQLLRAEVVEVTPLYHVEPIRIVPIKVEMSKRVVDSVPVYRVGPQT